ncbi:hypothetical protein AAMO2058_000067600 [Amorphochlora amoebiformis]
MSAGKSKSKTTKSRSPQHTRSGESMPGVGCKRSRMSTFPAGTLDNQIVHIETPISQFPNFDLKLTSSSGTNNELLTLTRQIAQKTQIPPDDQILYYAGTERVDYAKRLRSDCPITLLKRMPEYSNEGLQEESRDSLVEKLTGQVVWISDIPSAFPGLRYLSKNLYHKSMAAKLRAIDGECECKPGTCRLGRCPCFQSYGYRQCNSHCGCDNSCENKAMLTGSDLVHRNNLYLFYSKHKQWGLRTGSDIKKGQFVIEYIGEMVSYKEYKRRGGIYDKLGVNYQLMVNEHFPKRNINLSLWLMNTFRSEISILGILLTLRTLETQPALLTITATRIFRFVRFE